MIDLEHAIVYDIETLPNCFTFHFVALNSDLSGTFEISQFRDDRRELLAWFAYWQAHQVPMIGYNNLAFDYPVIHFIYNNQDCSVWEIFDKAQDQINDHTMFSMVWESDRFAPQIDLYKIHHFDNRAKRTSLKALQVNMRAESVEEMPLAWDSPLSPDQIEQTLIPYNRHDVTETKRFAHFSMDAIKFRLGLSETLTGDVLNFNDTKIGAKILEHRLGEELCYTRENGRREPRQTIRHSIALSDIIFPYVRFSNPEFNKVLSWMRGQVLSADELTETIRTKDAFTGVHATVGGIDFHFGTGGIHGSVPASRWAADDEWAIVDIDVASLYPNIAIVNRLYPEHLGHRFVEEYARLPKERKEWQAKKGKKCTEANSMKLASNGTYGNSNNKFSVFYDPKFTMTITINGQLLLCMLAEWLLTVPTLQIIQINTDGITYRIHRSQMAATVEVRDAWQAYTRLVLDEAHYSKMWIRDVNNYVAEGTDGNLKQKGAYWYPRKFPDDISNAQPPAWHKDFSAQVCVMAAVEHMTKGVSLEQFILAHRDPFDFMCRAKVDRSSTLWIGDKQVQRIQRYYVAKQGGRLRKIAKPKGTPGTFKRKNGISDHEYYSILQTLPPDTWDARIHTKNKNRYPTTTEQEIEAGYLVADCNRASDFDHNNVDTEYYIDRARELVVFDERTLINAAVANGLVESVAAFEAESKAEKERIFKRARKALLR